MKLRNQEKRRGAAVVEFALVAPVFIMLVFGMLEFGRGVMVQQVLVNASREGARMAVLEGATVGEIEDRMDVYLDSANINTKTIIYTINGTQVADPTTVANFGDAIGVEIRVNFDDVSWVPIPQYIGGKILRATSFMRRETSQPL
jgi:Flp pilus assembly protein TadG